MTVHAASRLEADFMNATGAAVLEWASDPLAYYKILNETAFERFQKGGCVDFDNLFTSCSPANLESISFGERLVGEFFARVKLGQNVRIGNDVNMIAHGGITLGDDVRIGDNVQLVTVFHSIHPAQRLPIRTSPIIIEDGAVIESGALIISSRRNGAPLIIGRNAKVLANSVVVSNVAENAIVSGRPARPVAMDEYLQQSFSTASQMQMMNIDTMALVREKLGPDVDVCTPISVSGAEHIASEGFYLLNRRCLLDLHGQTQIGQGVLMAPAVSLTVEPGASLSIGRQVWIGAGASIHARTGQALTIGEGSIIGAGATITESVPPHVLMLEENLLKRAILADDYDETIPDTWTDIASILDLRSQDRVNRVQSEVDTLLASGKNMRTLMSLAQESIRLSMSGPQQSDTATNSRTFKDELSATL